MVFVLDSKAERKHEKRASELRSLFNRKEGCDVKPKVAIRTILIATEIRELLTDSDLGLRWAQTHGTKTIHHG